MTAVMDVIVGWLQNDYGKLGRPAEAIAHALSAERGVAYVEPFRAGGSEAELSHRVDGRLHVFQGAGTPPVGAHEIANAVVGTAGLERPALLNFGVSEVNWWLHYEFAPVCAATVLVTYDKLALWEAMAPRAALLEGVRDRLVACSDAVCGMSLGSIDDVAGARYVGHGCDAAWHEPAIDDRPEPPDLAAIPRPRAIYVGALSMRFDQDAICDLARAGVNVVLVGIAPPPQLLDLVRTEERLHFLGPRPAAETPGYLLHSDVGIVPHTDEPFTRSMEPHKAYNYACAGLPTVTLNTEHAPALDGVLTATTDRAAFVEAVGAAVAAGRLDAGQIARARELSWAAVAEAMMETAEAVTRR
jgi:glycosyltransferase involved in cell wall biosynthesis